jgi:hypothetical protein
MATLIAETTWHGNPRPVLAYASSVEDGVVASPYYFDQRDVPIHAHFVTSVPIGTLAPTAVADVPGPDVLVSFDVGGAWLTGSSLTILLTLVGSPDFSASLSPGPTPAGPEAAAAAFAAAINADVGLTAAAVDRKVTVSAVVPTTAITITTLTPVTP